MSNEEEIDTQQKIASILGEILKWAKVTSIPQVKKTLLDTLTTDNDKVAYENSDGVKTSRIVGKASHLGKDAITRRWKSWIVLGIAEPAAVKGRGRRVFSLADFGITIPVLGGDATRREENQMEENDSE